MAKFSLVIRRKKNLFFRIIIEYTQLIPLQPSYYKMASVEKVYELMIQYYICILRIGDIYTNEYHIAITLNYISLCSRNLLKIDLFAPEQSLA